MFTTTREKMAEAEKIGVAAVLESGKDAFGRLAASLDFILSTVPETNKVTPLRAAAEARRHLRGGGCARPDAGLQQPGAHHGTLLMTS